MVDLPAELAAFASLLDAQPAPARDAFNYCLCLMMVEAGKMRIAETTPSETGTVCVFETAVGDQFSVLKPRMNEEQETALIAILHEILDEEGMP